MPEGDAAASTAGLGDSGAQSVHRSDLIIAWLARWNLLQKRHRAHRLQGLEDCKSIAIEQAFCNFGREHLTDLGAEMISQETTHLSLRQQLKHYLPKSFLLWRKRRQWEPIRQRYAALSVKDAFTNIYSSKLWGDSEAEEFFSGTGSTERFAAPYVDWLTRFIGEHGIKTVVDLGCGDFQVGRKICSANAATTYVGIDVVPGLVEYNQSRFGGEHVEFRCANIVEDNLPEGDLCLIRQVLQHLSNAQVSRVLAKSAKYNYLLVTESVSMGRVVRPNLDIPHGPDVRASDNSGLFLDLPPFNLRTRVVLEIPDPTHNLNIRTMLVDNLKKVIVHS